MSSLPRTVVEARIDAGSDDANVDGRTGTRRPNRPLKPGPTVVVGGGQLGRSIARRLAGTGRVHYVDRDQLTVERAAREHPATHVVDLTDRRALATVVEDATAVVVATPHDATNLLVAQHCRTVFDVPRVVVVVADPRNRDIYPPDVERVCAAATLSDAVTATVVGESPLAEGERE